MPETKKCANPRCDKQLELQAQFCPSCGTPQPLTPPPPRPQQSDFFVAVAPWTKITERPQATIAVYTGVACLAASALPLLISESLHFSLGGAVWIFALVFVACAVGTYLEYRAAAIIGFCGSVLNALLVSTNDYASHFLFIISLMLAAGTWAGVKGTTWKFNAAG